MSHLEHFGSHRGHQELVHVTRERRSAREDLVDFAAERLAHRPEEEAEAGAAAAVLSRVELELHGVGEEGADEGRLGLDRAHHLNAGGKG